jgi:hypothetical protein
VTADLVYAAAGETMDVVATSRASLTAFEPAAKTPK